MTETETPQQNLRSASLLPVAGMSEEERKRAFRWFFFLVFGVLLYQILLILSLFSDAIIWASSLALVFFPVHHFFQRRLGNRRTLTAALSTTCVLLLVLIPLLLLGWVVVEQSSQVYPTVRDWVTQLQSLEARSVESILPLWLRDYWLHFDDWLARNELLSQFDFKGFLLNNIDAASVRIADFGAATARNLLVVFLNLLLIVVGVFFCFRDGERFLRWFFEVLPMPAEQARTIAGRVYLTITAIIRGELLTALVQAVLAMIGYLIAGVPLAIFFGVLTGFAAMIPVIGAGLVWAPIGVFILSQNVGWGIFVLVWGFFVVSLIDNFLKPILIGTGARMPILLIFCAIIGGANIYGFTGIIIGPILIACLLAFFAIYREYYAARPAG